MKKHVKDQPFTFQQDETLHYPIPQEKLSTSVNDIFSRFWSYEMWSPEFPDLNFIEFFVWTLLKVNVCSVAHPSVDARNLFCENGLKYFRKRCVPQLVTSDRELTV